MLFLVLGIDSISQECGHWYLCKQLHSVSMIKDIRICRNCGVVFDLQRRQDKDCPVCHHGEHLAFETDK